MRIVGNQKHDFYDKVLTHGFDEDLVFVRNASKFHVGTKLSDHPQEHALYYKRLATYRAPWSMRQCVSSFGIVSHFGRGTGNDVFSVSAFVLLFCGKVFPCVKFAFGSTAHFKGQSGFVYVDNATYVYNEHTLYQMMEKHSKEIKKYNEQYSANFEKQVVPKVRTFLEPSGIYDDDVATYLYEHKIAYMTICDSKERQVLAEVEYHPLLKNIGFVHHMDPFTVFQEISMFVGNTPRDPNMMVTLTDKEELVKKGFDNWSFKKFPTKKKGK